MKVVIINQARMTSTRLPGKVLKEVLGKPLLEYQIERLRRIELADELVIATTTNGTDQPIVDLCEKLGVSYYRGSENDVLSRYYEAAQKYGADIIVRVTSDCPLIDPAVIDKVIKYFLDHQGQYDYVSNVLKRTYPRGMDTEVFSFQVLQDINASAVNLLDREHVTRYIYQNPQKYRLGNVRDEEDHSDLRWTVDTQEDFEFIKMILEVIYSSKHMFSFYDCLMLLQQNPELLDINRHVEQKIY